MRVSKNKKNCHALYLSHTNITEDMISELKNIIKKMIHKIYIIFYKCLNIYIKIY
jgi:hypothetical protein